MQRWDLRCGGPITPQAVCPARYPRLASGPREWGSLGVCRRCKGPGALLGGKPWPQPGLTTSCFPSTVTTKPQGQRFPPALHRPPRGSPPPQAAGTSPTPKPSAVDSTHGLSRPLPFGNGLRRAICCSPSSACQALGRLRAPVLQTPMHRRGWTSDPCDRILLGGSGSCMSPKA